MALSALQPLVLDFIDTLTGGWRRSADRLRSSIAMPESCLAGCTLNVCCRRAGERHCSGLPRSRMGRLLFGW